MILLKGGSNITDKAEPDDDFKNRFIATVLSTNRWCLAPLMSILLFSMSPMHEATCPLILATMADRKIGKIVGGKLDELASICGIRIVLLCCQGLVVEASELLRPDDVNYLVVSISLLLKTFLVWLPLSW